tara:strand:- start:96909 stop:98012 length:1104 start_codon:yes stop_codon:yes gene_type:complete
MKKQSKIYWTLSIVIIAIFVVTLAITIPKGDETIQIGSILSLSGAAASWGEAAQDGISLVVEDINSKGGVLGKKVVVIYEDDQSNPTQTVTAFRKLTEVDEVKVIIGPSWTKMGLTIKTLVDDEVVISPSLGGVGFNEGNKYIFNTRQHDYILSKNLAESVYSEGHRTVAILSVNDPYNKEQADEFERVFEDLGGTVQYVFEPTMEQRDVRTDLLKAKSDAKVDALVATTGATPLTSIFAIQLKELGMDYLVYSVTIDQTRIDESKGTIDGWKYLSSFTPNEDFSERYLQEFNKKIHISSDSAYDAAMMIFQAMEETESTDHETIQKYLSDLDRFSRVSGNLVADGDGGFTKNYITYEVRNGIPQLV